MMYNNIKELLRAICDSIREKEGTEQPIPHQDIPERIRKLKGDGNNFVEKEIEAALIEKEKEIEQTAELINTEDIIVLEDNES